MKRFILPILCATSTTALAAQSSCDYKVNTDTSYEGVIEASKDYVKKTIDHLNGTRKCVIQMEAKINNEWYSTIGQYIFGPDMAENDACKKAEIRAKENLLRLKVSEKLKSTMKKNCAVSVRTVPVKTVPVKKSPLESKPKKQGKIISVTPVAMNNCPKKWFIVWIGGEKTRAYKEVCE